MGQLLAHEKVTKKNLELALQTYDISRRPIAERAAEQSRTTGLMLEFNVPEYENINLNDLSTEDLNRLGRQIDDQWCWQWKTIPDQDWARAEKLLMERLKRY